MPLALRYATQRKLSALLTAMPRNGIAYAPIDGAAFDLRFRHCRAPRRVTGSARFHLFWDPFHFASCTNWHNVL